MIKSKLTIRAYLTIFSFPFFILIIIYFHNAEFEDYFVKVWTLIFLYAFGLIWINREIRKKMNPIELNHKVLIEKKFLGLGKRTEVKLNQKKGYNIYLLKDRLKNNPEEIAIIFDGKKSIRYNNIYHKNYNELKELIPSKHINTKTYSFKELIKDCFYL